MLDCSLEFAGVVMCRYNLVVSVQLGFSFKRTVWSINNIVMR